MKVHLQMKEISFQTSLKAFDQSWHKGLVYKLKSYGISGNLLKPIENYLTNRKQTVVLYGQISFWENVLSGITRGSVLGPLFFLIHINDLPDQSVCRIFAILDHICEYSRY